MKVRIAFIILALAVSAHAQRWSGGSQRRGVVYDSANADSYYVPPPRLPPDWRIAFVPQDPWRAVYGQTNYVKWTGVLFHGQVVDVMPDGVRIDGQWGPLSSPYSQTGDFFVLGYPYQVVNDQMVQGSLMAFEAGTYTYSTVGGGSRTITELNYGTPCGPDPAKVAALQRQIQEQESARRQFELKKLQALMVGATNGDASMEYSLGVHYLYGSGGCETNKQAAIFWLTKSAAQGNMDASNDLTEMKR